MRNKPSNKRSRPVIEQGPKNYRDPGMKRFLNFFSSVSFLSIDPSVPARTQKALNFAVLAVLG